MPQGSLGPSREIDEPYRQQTVQVIAVRLQIVAAAHHDPVAQEREGGSDSDLDGLLALEMKIDRGEEVKKETLQQVAIKLQVMEEYFRPAAEVKDDGDVPERNNCPAR